MKAMVAEKLFDVASAAGMTMDQVMEAYSSQQEGSTKKKSYVGDNLDRQVKANKLSSEEAERQKGVLKVLGVQDGLSLPDGTLERMGKGQLIVRSDGIGLLTGEDDGVAISTNIRKGGSSGGTGGGSGDIHIGTVVVKADDPETFRKKLKQVAKTKLGKNAMRGRGR